MKVFRHVAGAALLFLAIGAATAAALFIVLGFSPFGPDVLDAGWGSTLAGGVAHERGWASVVSGAAMSALLFILRRAILAVLFGLAWAWHTVNRKRWSLVVVLAVPIVCELILALPLASTWLGFLAASIYYLPDPPRFVLPLRHTAALAMAFLGPPALAGAVTAGVLSRWARRARTGAEPERLSATFR